MDSERLDEDVLNQEELNDALCDEMNVDSCPNEASIDPTYCDGLDEIGELDEEQEAKFRKGTKIFWRLLIFLNALLLCGLVYMKHIMWNPTERDLCDDNIFCGNSLSISDEELEKIVDTLENELGICIDEDCKDEYALLNAVYENDCLTDEEKQVFYGFIDIIKDNPYIDRESAYSSLRNVEVSYKCRPYMYDRTVLGVYSHQFESIGIFEKDEDQSILKHEGIHAIFCNENTISLPTYFKEGMTELLVNEYFQNKPFIELENYPFEIAAVKMLCEVTSPDIVLKAYSLGNMDIIAEEMATITGDIEVARNALDMLDKAFLKYHGDLEDDLTYEEIVNVFIPVFRGIVTAKYEESDSNRVSYYYNEILLGNIFYPDAYDSYVDDLVEFGSDHKAYFSSKLKNILASQEIVDKISDNDAKSYKKEK